MTQWFVLGQATLTPDYLDQRVVPFIWRGLPQAVPVSPGWLTVRRHTGVPLARFWSAIPCARIQPGPASMTRTWLRVTLGGQEVVREFLVPETYVDTEVDDWVANPPSVLNLRRN